MDDLDDYKPSGGPSTVQFVVLVSADGVAADERVVLKGNLPALGAWERSIPLARSADDPCIWEVEVELPIGMAETHKKALFEFRYAIEPADGVGEAVEEGGVSRRHLEMHSRFSHSFKSLIDPDNGRPTVGDRVRLAKGVGSKGALKVGAIGEILQDDRDHLPYKIAGKDKAFSWYKESDVELVDPRPPPAAAATRPNPHVDCAAAFRLFFRRDWSLLCDGRLDPVRFLRNFQGLASGVPDRTRADAEALFDELLAEHAATGQLPPPIPTFAMLGAVVRPHTPTLLSAGTL